MPTVRPQNVPPRLSGPPLIHWPLRKNHRFCQGVETKIDLNCQKPGSNRNSFPDGLRGFTLRRRAPPVRRASDVRAAVGSNVQEDLATALEEAGPWGGSLSAKARRGDECCGESRLTRETSDQTVLAAAAASQKGCPDRKVLGSEQTTRPQKGQPPVNVRNLPRPDRCRCLFRARLDWVGVAWTAGWGDRFCPGRGRTPCHVGRHPNSRLAPIAWVD